MIEHLDPLGVDPLAQRLDRLAVKVPPAPDFRTDAPLSHDPRRLSPTRWQRTAVALGVGLLAALTVTAAGYPGGILGLSRAALSAAGLSRHDVIALSGSATGEGLQVSVDGGYADQISTVLFVNIKQTCQPEHCAIGAPYLTDQFGDRYQITGGEGIGVGPYPTFFQPLSPAAANGATLTLHIPVNERGLTIPLSGQLNLRAAQNLALPPSIVDSARHVRYEVTGLDDSHNYLEVHTRLTGQLSNVIVHFRSHGQVVTGKETIVHPLSGESWPGVFLVAPDGSWLTPVALNGGSPGSVNTHLQDETRVFAVHHRGIYRLVVANSSDPNSSPGPGWSVLAEWTVRMP